MEWCVGMVVVLKVDGKVWICVDLIKFNESILREYYFLFNIDYILVLLVGVIIFSKFDVLFLELVKLIIFIMFFGRFCFNCLLFGISLVFEYF